MRAPATRPVTVIALACSVAAGSLLLSAPSAHAASAATDTITLLAPADVALNIAGSAATGCSVQAWGAGASIQGTGPYTLHLDPADLDLGANTVTVETWGCESGDPVIQISALVPYKVTTPAVIAPRAQDTSLRRGSIQVKASEGVAVNVSIVHDGKKVAGQDGIVGQASIKVPATAANAAGQWSVNVTSSAGDSQYPLLIADRWAPIDSDMKHFTRCSTLTWALKGAGQPSRAKGIERDIESSLNTLSKATGLTFTRTDDWNNADMQYFWGSPGGAAGLGGYSWSSHNGQESMRGTVELSRTSWWLGQAGSKRVHGVPGRIILLEHETMHALGLGHVNDKRQVMNPVTSAWSPTAPAAGDKAGLAHLYQPASCTP